MDFNDFPKGSKVVFTEDTDRFPHFLIPAGTTGTVIESEESAVAVHVDQFVEGLSDSKEWSGDFFWTNDEWDEDTSAPFAIQG